MRREPFPPVVGPIEQEDRTVIRVTRLNGEQFALNPDLIERVEAHPDTVAFLVDGTKYVVRESVELIARLSTRSSRGTTCFATGANACDPATFCTTRPTGPLTSTSDTVRLSGSSRGGPGRPAGAGGRPPP